MIPLAHYYVIAGKVYQAPDLGSIVNSRLSNCANYLQQAFSETHSYAKYQSAKGYYWEFKDKESQVKAMIECFFRDRGFWPMTALMHA